jgi:hypothetical protein
MFDLIGSPGRGSKRTFGDISVLIGMPFSRWGAQPFAIDPLPYPVTHIGQLIREIDSGSKRARSQQHPTYLA